MSGHAVAGEGVAAEEGACLTSIRSLRGLFRGIPPLVASRFIESTYSCTLTLFDLFTVSVPTVSVL